MTSLSSRRPWSKTDKSFLIDNYLRGMSVKRISEILGRTINSVEGEIRILGLSEMRKEIKDENQKTILEFLVDHTIKQTAAHFGITSQFTKQIAESYPGGLKNLRFERKRNAAIKATSHLFEDG